MNVEWLGHGREWYFQGIMLKNYCQRFCVLLLVYMLLVRSFHILDKMCISGEILHYQMRYRSL